MSKPFKPRRGTTAQHASFIGEAHEVTFDTDKNTLVTHDGVTAGGFPLATSAELEAFKTSQATRDSQQDSAITAAQSAANNAQTAATSAASAASAAQATANRALAKEAVLPGTVVAFAANKTLTGYLLCNGATVSRTTYAALFAEIGTTYGAGDGSSTFALPNLTDRFIQGSGTAGTVKAAGLPGIRAATNVLGATELAGVQEAFYMTSDKITSKYQINRTTNTSNLDGSLAFDASRSNSIYSASNTVQPPALTMRYHIKY